MDKQREAYLDDNIILMNYRALVARMAANEAGKIACFTFADFLDEPVFSESNLGYVEIRFVAVFRDELEDSLYEVSSTALVTPHGRIIISDYSSIPFTRPVSDDFFSQHLPFGGEEVI